MVYREQITWPPVREEEVLAYVSGGERKDTVILSGHDNVAPVETVSVDPSRGLTQNQKVYRAGIVVAKVTKDVGGGEAESGKWGPLDQAATDDGRDAQACAFKQDGAGNAIMRFTSLRPGMIGRNISIAVVDNAGVSDPLTVTVTEQPDGTTDIVVELATGADTVEVSTAAEVIAAVNADPEASKVIQAANGGSSDGTGLAAAFAAAFLTGDRHGVEIGVVPIEVNVEFGDVPAAIYVGNCVFRKDKLIGYTGNEANVDAALADKNSEVVAVSGVAP